MITERSSNMKNILVFNDISGLGNCSLGANLPVFAKLGHYAIPIVTGTFSCQTGFVNFTFSRNDNLSKCAADVLSHRVPDAVYVGFCVDSGILSEVCNVLDSLYDSFVFVDPILGDNGNLYSIFDGAHVEAMKRAVRNAHCISPNLTEACLLADVDYKQLISRKNQPAFLSTCGETFGNFLEITGAQSAVITGVECGDSIGNIVLSDGKVRYVTNERVPVNYSGTGDVFSSVLLGELLRGKSTYEATLLAANFVCKAAQNTECPDRRFGVEFCKVLNLL